MSNKQRPSTQERRQNSGRKHHHTDDEGTRRVNQTRNPNTGWEFFRPTPSPENTEETSYVPFTKLLINALTGPKIINLSKRDLN